VHIDEPAGSGLVEAVALVVGSQVEVVQRLGAAPAVDRNVPTVQHHSDFTGHIFLGLGDEGLQRLLQRRVPQTVVNQFRPTLVGFGA